MGIETRGSSEPNKHKKEPVGKIPEGAEQGKLFTESSPNKESKSKGPSPLARAIASRKAIEEEQTNMFLAAKTGELPPQTLTSNDLRATMIDAILKKRDGSRQHFEDKLKSTIEILDEETMQQLINTFPTTQQKTFIAKFSPEQMHQVLQATVKLTEDTDTDIGFDLINGIEVAKEFARERGVPPETVYEDEEIYKEFAQKRWTPEQFAAGMLYSLGQKFDPEKQGRAFLAYQIRIDAIEKGQWDTVEESIEYTTNKKLTDAKRHPDFIAQLDQGTKRQEDIITSLTRSQIKRFWGEDALDNLPDNLRSRLAVSDPEKEQAELAKGYHQVGLMLYEANRSAEALKPAEKGAELNPTNPAYKILVGAIHSELGNFEAEIKSVVQTIELDPRNPKYRDLLGNSYIHTGQFEEAVEAFQMAIDLSNPKKDQDQLVEYYSNLSYSLTMLKRYEEALDPSKKAAELKPDQPIIVNNLGRNYTYLGMHEEALEVQLKAVELDPGNITYWNDLGATYTHLGIFEEAEKTFTHALTLNPQALFPKVGLGRVQIERKQYKNAEQLLTQVIATDSRHAEPYYLLALAKGNLGRDKAAKSLLHIAIDRADPENEQALIERIQRELSDGKEKYI